MARPLPPVAPHLVAKYAGYWDASTTTAFALEARDAKETQELPLTPMRKLLTLLGGMAEMAVDAGDSGDDGARHANDSTAMDDVMSTLTDVRNAHRTKSGTKAVDVDLHDDGSFRDSRSSMPRRSVSTARAAALSDCPLTFSVSAISRSLPVALLRLRAEDPSINVVRVWTTMLCIYVLERMNVSWIWGDGNLYPEQERTIVDGAREWIEIYAHEHPALFSVLEDGSVRRAAEKVAILWHRAAEQRVLDLRRAPAIRLQMHRSHVHRTLTSIVRAVTNQRGAC